MVDYGVEGVELLPVNVHGRSIECVTEFPNLRALIAANGPVNMEEDKWVASPSEVFGVLQFSVFKNIPFS